MNGVSTRRKKGCNVHVPAFMYAQSIGPQLTFIKTTLLERTGVGRLCCKSNVMTSILKSDFESADASESS